MRDNAGGNCKTNNGSMMSRARVATHCVAVGQDLAGLSICLNHDSHCLLIQLDQIMQIVIAEPAHVSFVSFA